MEYGKGTWVIRILLLVVFLWLFLYTDVQAQEQLYFDEEGNLLMTTYDRIATNNIRYKTIGWTIKRYNRPIGEDNESVIVVLEDNGAPQPDPANPAYQYCYFKCDKQTIFDRIGAVSAQWQQELYLNGGTVYLDAVMTVTENGVLQGNLLSQGDSYVGEVYRTFEGIAAARPWSDPQALRTHFDKWVYFGGNPALLSQDCSYEIRHFECFESGGAFWSLSRYGCDKNGMLSSGTELVASPENFSGYYFQYVSAEVRKYYMDGREEVFWTEEYPVSVWNEEMAPLQSVCINLYYKRQEQLAYASDKYNLQDGSVIMDGQFEVGSGTNQIQPFDVQKGVPTGEMLYVEGKINPVGYEVNYTRHYGMKTCPVTIVSMYHCQWEDVAWGMQEQDVVIPEEYYVDRSYSYWEIRSIEVYTCLGVQIHNYAFDGEVTELESGYEPDIVVDQRTEHVRAETVEEYWIDGGTLIGMNERAQLPYGIRQQEANQQAGYVMVCNDAFSIGEEVFLSGNEVRSSGGDPRIGADFAPLDLYEEGLLIPKEKRNGADYPSTAIAVYGKYNGQERLEQEVGNVNAVSLHTPVVCRIFASDEKQYNQLCKPSKQSMSLILGRNFSVALSAYGQHLEQKGYGEQNYERYTGAYEVRFPFPVYYGEEYFEENTWIACGEETQFYLPTGVEEGIYRIYGRTLAYNYTSEDAVQEMANLSMEEYGAYDSIQVQVCGRLYGMRIVDIERKEWENVFVSEENMYTVGLHNLNGEQIRTDWNKTFPILQGGNPNVPEEEGEPLGTTFTYQIETIGDYAEEDGIEIRPEFYVTDMEGGERRRVDIYHFYEGKWENILSHSESNPGKLSSEARTNIGDIHHNVEMEQTAAESVQLWEGDYCIPEDIYVVLHGEDVEQYIQDRGHIDITDEIFIRTGYLLVKFQIYSVKEGKKHLSYTNEENAKKGYANMWKLEGFTNPKKKGDGSLFEVQCGDVFLYDLQRQASDRYAVMGTH